MTTLDSHLFIASPELSGDDFYFLQAVRCGTLLVNIVAWNCTNTEDIPAYMQILLQNRQQQENSTLGVEGDICYLKHRLNETKQSSFQHPVPEMLWEYLNKGFYEKYKDRLKTPLSRDKLLFISRTIPPAKSA